MDTNVKNFLKQLLQDGGQTGLPIEIEEQLLEDLNQRLEQKLILVAIDNLVPEKQAELHEMTEKGGKPEEIMIFLRANIVDLDQLFRNAMEEFRNTYLAN